MHRRSWGAHTTHPTRGKGHRAGDDDATTTTTTKKEKKKHAKMLSGATRQRIQKCNRKEAAELLASLESTASGFTATYCSVAGPVEYARMHAGLVAAGSDDYA